MLTLYQARASNKNKITNNFSELIKSIGQIPSQTLDWQWECCCLPTGEFSHIFLDNCQINYFVDL